MASDASGPNLGRPQVEVPGPVELSGQANDGSSVVVAKLAERKLLTIETLAWLVWTALADLLIFRAWGLSGPAVFFAIVPLFFWIVARPIERPKLALFCSVCCWLVSARLLWSGGPLVVFVGTMIVPALSIAVAGEFPWLLETIALALRSPFDGMARMTKRLSLLTPYNEPWIPPRETGGESFASSPGTALSYGLPLVAATAFGGIFVFANPDLYTWVTKQVEQMQSLVWEFFSGMSFFEVPFCIAAFFIGVGLLRPRQPLTLFGPRDEPAQALGATGRPAVLYSAFCNTLVTLIVLFSVYLCFEFATLWRRQFPEGFYYAGYAHEGAAWLTFALALATGTMSLIFSGNMLQDLRLGRLKRLAWIWSAQNFLLAIAVYNRLLIYVGYNGLTRMRWIGFFGITLVVVGVVIVLVKIAKGRSFWWLLRTQLVAFGLTIAFYAIFPVDFFAHRYNASRIKEGYLHPSVMIAVKPIDNEGIFPLLQLVDVSDEKIREGVLALLAERQSQIEEDSTESPWHWTRFQGSSELLYGKLAKNQGLWAKYLQAPHIRAQAIADFREYAMKWY